MASSVSTLDAIPQRRPRAAVRAFPPPFSDARVATAHDVLPSAARDLMPRRNVLFVTSRFPPVASVGALRARKFCKYLRDNGWFPVVLTGPAEPDPRAHADSAAAARDLDSLRDIAPDTPVVRLSAARSFSGGLPMLLGALTAPFGLDAACWREALTWRLERIRRRCSFPDAGIWRLPAALRVARRLHRRFRFEAIFSSGMPFSDHLIALAIREAIRRPWIADFRDPWVEYVYWEQWRSPAGRLLARAAEFAVVRRADCVTTIGRRMSDRFAARYPAEPRAKFATILNGFDPADFPHALPAPRRNDGGFRVVYLGSLYGPRGPQVFLRAFRRFLSERPDACPVARLEFAGRPGPHLPALKAAAADGSVRLHGLLPHADALRLMLAADVLVDLQPDHPGTDIDLPAKLYEYLGSGRPILAVVPADGDAAELLARFDGVWIVPPDDEARIAVALAALFDRWSAHTLGASRPAAQLQPLTRQHQARQLATLLDAAVTRRRPRSRPTGAA